VTPPIEGGAFRFDASPIERDGSLVNAISQYFGANPDNYEQFGLIGHSGVDLVGKSWSKLFAVSAGVVERAVDPQQTQSAYGGHVYITHENGAYTTVTGHMEKVNVRVGQVVAAGECIGWMGSTGNSTGTHAHLELRKRGATGTGETPYKYGVIDPMPYLFDLINRTERRNFVDVLPYLLGEPNKPYVMRVYSAKNEDMGEERVEIKIDPADPRGWGWYVTKDAAGSKVEKWACTGRYIRLLWDSSPSPENGVQAYYDVVDADGLDGGRWCERFMEVGVNYVEPRDHQVTFRRIANCSDYGDSRSGYNRNRTTLYSVVGDELTIGNLSTEMHVFKYGKGRVRWINNAATHPQDASSAKWIESVDLSGEPLNGLSIPACL
jgi:hypothetical protein